MFSKFKEYLSLIPEGLKNRDKILEGLWNEVKSLNGSLSEDEQEEVLRRKLICRNCPFHSINLKQDDSEYRKLYNKPFETSRDDKFCGICSCKENLKTSCLSCNCGLEYHNEQHPENKQQLKWEAYKK